MAKLEAEGVLHRAPDGSGFDVDASRVAYLRYLRRERRQSPRTEADADHVKAKTEMLKLRLMEKKRELVRREDVEALIDGIAGHSADASVGHGSAYVVSLKQTKRILGGARVRPPRGA